MIFSTCADPRCEHILGKDNVSGCCALHAHGAHCRCERCRNKPKPLPEWLDGTAEKRSASVTCISSTSSTNHVVKVSLPREPWA